MNNIKIIDDNINLRQDEKSDLYINIFGEEPWNEWYQCNDCWKLFWLSETVKNDIKQCLCGSELCEFYDKKQVDKDRNQRYQKEWYIWKLAENLKKEFVWFILWWETNLIGLNNEKLWLEENELYILIKNIETRFEDFDLNDFFYGAELWVKKEFRWQGIASKLYKKREENFRENWKKYILIRTTKKTEKPYKWYKKDWFVDIYDYNDQQDRVIMIKKIL